MIRDFFNGAGDGARTRDIQLGKLTLYQLSHTRVQELYILTEAYPSRFVLVFSLA